MNGLIVSFRRGRHTITGNQVIVKVDGVGSIEAAGKLVGKKVVYNTGKKDISGEIKAAHGNKGAVRVLFEKGMPGQAVGGRVTVK